MSEPQADPKHECSPNARPLRGTAALLQKHRWLTFLLPFLVYMLMNSLEPTPPEAGDAAAEAVESETEATETEASDGWRILPAVPYEYYPWLYTLKIVLTLAAIVFVLPGYREFPFRLSPLALLVGIVGVVAWVGLCSLQLEQRFLVPLLTPIGLDGLIASGTRAAYNPFEQLAGNPLAIAGFLAVRFLGLVAVVALIEEFFLRGFVMRMIVDADWWKVPFGRVTVAAAVAGTLVPMLMHPAELLAAAVWFSMVTWLMVTTRNIWDCVAAHAVTNLLLGLYVVIWGQWHLM